jgi:hypothetical protein
VNRSVINCMIAAGVLATGAGFSPAPARADPNESGTVSGSDSPRPVRPNGRPGKETPDAGKEAGRPCEWSRVCRPGSHRRSGGNRGTSGNSGNSDNSGLGMIPLVVAPVLPRPPVAVVEPVAPTAFDVPSNKALAPSTAEGAAAAGAPAAPSVGWATPPSPVVPTAAPRTKPVAVAPLPAAPAAKPLSLPAPAPPAAPPQAPEEAVGVPRLGYPDELRNADFGKVAARALPGLAAIAGMTALGGVFGYRQARAGYVLRTAGAGRFLQ